jgi:hypothetical protein
MESIIIELIEKIIKDHSALINICMRQKAKFEGWLKFELAQALELFGVEQLSVEYGYDKKFRADISYIYQKERFLLELKTSNTNWVIDGIESKTRPITKNIDSIIIDGVKLSDCDGTGIVVFILFPLPLKDQRWNKYLYRISESLDVTFEENKNYKLIPCKANDISCEILLSSINAKLRM